MQTVPFRNPELTNLISRVIGDINGANHGLSFLNTSGQPVAKDSIKKLLVMLSNIEISGNDYELSSKTCSDINFLIWTAKTKTVPMKSIQKISVDMKFQLDNKTQNTITITDFDFYSSDKPNHVTLRIVDVQYLQYLKMDSFEINAFAESVPAGIDRAIDRLDRLKKNACR